MGSDDCCRIPVLKGVLYAFQFLFLIAGLAICGVGAWKYLNTYHFINVTDSTPYLVTLILFIITGCLAILTFFFGCCAIQKHMSKLLFCYILLLVLIFLLEVLVSILAYIYQINIENMHLHLNESFLNNYHQSEDKTASIDFIQQNLHCCGAHSFHDWKYSIWLQNNTDELYKVPDSCCKTMTLYCGYRDHPSNIYFAECMYKIIDNMRLSLWIICAVSLGFSVIQIFGVIFGIKLFLKLESQDTNYSPNSNGSEALIPT